MSESIRILIIEDDEVNLIVTSSVLESRGYEVEGVANGRDAIDRLQASSFNLVLTDCNLPVLDGFETARIIRGLEKHAQIPILAMSGEWTTESRARAVACGINGILEKPFALNVLVKSIQDLLSQKNSLNLERVNKPVLMSLNAKLRNSIIDLFIKTAPEHVRKIREGDKEQIRSEAHNLKSSCGALGLDAAAKICEQIEKNPKNAEPMLEALNNEIQECIRFISEFKKA